MDKITGLRRKIDKADEQIISLLKERLDIAVKINDLKQKHGQQALDAKRWSEVITSRLELAQELDLDQELVKDVFNRIHRQVLAEARAESEDRGQRASGPSLFYLGPAGSYSELAARQLAGEFELRSCDNFAKIYQQLKARPGSHALVPVENSITSDVHENVDAIFSGDFQIVGETYQPIELQLLGLPGAKLSDVKTIYSQPQALAQCQKLIKRLKATVAEAESTSTAAMIVVSGGDKRAAAIGSSGLAKASSLSVLAKNIGDEELNQTRFLLIKYSPKASSKPSTPSLGSKLTVLAEIPHRVGSLHNLLGAIAGARGNLTKIESRPIPGTAWRCRFWLDIDLAGANIESVWQALRSHCTSNTLLGVYNQLTKEKSHEK